MLLISRHFVRVRISLDKNKVYRGDDLNLLLEIENRGPFYFPLLKLEFNQNDFDLFILDVDDDNLKQRIVSSDFSFKELQKLKDNKTKRFRFYKHPHLVKSSNIINLALPQRSVVKHEINLRTTSKGSFILGSDSILVQDIFSFFYLPLGKSSYTDPETKEEMNTIELKVLPNPNVWNLSKAGRLQDPERVQMATENIKVSDEVDALANIREYERGDRMKQIHWKLSARSGDWIVKEFEDPRQGGILFVLDPKLPDACTKPLTYTNEAAEIISASIKDLSMKEGPLNFLLNEDLYKAPGEGLEAYNFYEALVYWKAQIKSDDRRLTKPEFRNYAKVVDHRLGLGDLIEKETRNKIYRAVIITTARLSKSVINVCIRTQEQGTQVILLFMHNEDTENLNKMIMPLLSANIRMIPLKVSSLQAYDAVSEEAKDA